MVRPPQTSPANIYEKCQEEVGGRRSPLTSSTWLSTLKLGPDVTGSRTTVLVDVTDRVNVRARGKKKREKKVPCSWIERSRKRKKETRVERRRAAFCFPSLPVSLRLLNQRRGSQIAESLQHMPRSQLIVLTN